MKKLSNLLLGLFMFCSIGFGQNNFEFGDTVICLNFSTFFSNDSLGGILPYKTIFVIISKDTIDYSNTPRGNYNRYYYVKLIPQNYLNKDKIIEGYIVRDDIENSHTFKFLNCYIKELEEYRKSEKRLKKSNEILKLF